MKLAERGRGGGSFGRQRPASCVRAHTLLHVKRGGWDGPARMLNKLGDDASASWMPAGLDARRNLALDEMPQNRAAPRTPSTTSRAAKPSMAARPLSISAEGVKGPKASAFLAPVIRGMREAVVKTMAARITPIWMGRTGGGGGVIRRGPTVAWLPGQRSSRREGREGAASQCKRRHHQQPPGATAIQCHGQCLELTSRLSGQLAHNGLAGGQLSAQGRLQEGEGGGRDGWLETGDGRASRAGV